MPNPSLLMLLEAATFAIAASIHGGWLISGYEHREARIAESVIAAVLIAGAGLAMLPDWTRRAALGAQGFALVGTMVGIFTMVIGIGPRTVPDAVYHIAIVLVLMYGLVSSYSTTSMKTGFE